MTGIEVKVPRTPIHIRIGAGEFTDTDIREWAKGNIENAEWPRWVETSLIECLSQIIVGRVLDRNEPLA